MNATTNGIKNSNTYNFMAAFERIRANPKVILIVSSAAAISLIIALLFWAKSPDFRVLYSNISDQDGGAVVAELAQMNIPYRFDNSDGAILVPENKVHEVRLKLAQLGLPKGSEIGFELLDQEKFGISQFSEQVNFQRALEGELARTIETLGPVRTARVHLAIPKPSMFVSKQKQPSASVALNLTSGRSLDSGQVSAISYLLSSAVSGLNADNVTIVDQRGHLLTQKGGQALQTSRLKYTSKIEEDYQHRIQAILAPIVGNNNVRSQVTAQIDFTSHEQTAEQFQPNAVPEKMAIRSQQSSNAEQGGKSAVGGVPGALSNQPPAPTSAPIVQPGSTPTPTKGNTAKNQQVNQSLTNVTPYNSHKDKTTNYELDRTLTHITSSTGNIERLSVAVVLNYQPDKDGKPTALSKAQIEEINSLVKEAMGYSEQRGDSLNIVNYPFSTLDEDVTPPFWKQQNFIDLLLAAARYLFVAIVAWILWRKTVRPVWVKHQELMLQRLQEEKEARQVELNAQARKDEHSTKMKAQQHIETEMNAQHLRDMAEQEPQIVALVIRQWINKE